jgi:hypothetical protein
MKRQDDLAMLGWQRKFYELARWQKWTTVVIAIFTAINAIFIGLTVFHLV